MRKRRLLAVIAAAGTFVAALAGGLIVSREEPDSYDARIMLQVTRSILDDGDLRVTEDEFGFNTPYASYGLGMPALFLGPAALSDATGGGDADGANAAMATNAFAFALVTVAVLALGRAMGLAWGRSAVVAGLTATGTMLLPYAATGFSELPLAGAVALGLVAVAAAGRDRAWAAATGGVAVGLALLLRTDSAVVVAPAVAAGVLAGSTRRGRDLVHLAVAAAPFVATWAWYNAVRFGSPLSLGYAGTDGFDGDFRAGLFGLTLSPGRGLVWFVPLVAVALLGAPAAWRLNRAVTAAAGFVLVARILLFAAWSSWWGGVCWGPRFLVPAMPALAVGLAGAVSRYRHWARPLRVAVAATCAASVAIQVAGATVGYEHHWNQFHAKTEATGDPDAYLFDWAYWPPRHHAGWMLWQPEHFVGRFLPPARRPGPFAAAAGVVVWGTLAAAVAARRLDHEAEGAGDDGDPRAQPVALGGAGGSGRDYLSASSSPATSTRTTSPSP